jgi:hypothetical protein
MGFEKFARQWPEIIARMEKIFKEEWNPEACDLTLTSEGAEGRAQLHARTRIVTMHTKDYHKLRDCFVLEGVVPVPSNRVIATVLACTIVARKVGFGIDEMTKAALEELKS